MYAQPFEKMGTQTHPSTTTDCLHSFYSENLGPSKIKIQKKSTKKQKSISVISELNCRDGTDLEGATGELATIGKFFAMHSCEYLKVAKPDQQRTKILSLRNVRFFRGVEQLGHDDRELEFSDCVTLTFEKQKKDKKMDTVALMASKDARLCPVRAVAAIVRRIRKYTGSSQDPPISTVIVNGHLKQVTSTHMIHALRDAVGAIEEVKLGIKKENVGTHSIRSGAAMVMFLGECPVFMIMLIGGWSSDAFLRYIRKQVIEFSQNVAKRMLSCQNFRHIPDIHTRVQQDNPRIRNHPDNGETRRNVGGDSHHRVRLPPFSRSESSLFRVHEVFQLIWKHIGQPIRDRGRVFSNQ
jgi:hypothetical protein